MKRSYHLAISIDAAIERLKKGINLFEPATPTEALRDLTADRAKGHKFYTHCDNRHEDGTCAGHVKK